MYLVNILMLTYFDHLPSALSSNSIKFQMVKRSITQDDVDELFEEAKQGNKSKIKKLLDKSPDYMQLISVTTVTGGQNVFHILADTVRLE